MLHVHIDSYPREGRYFSFFERQQITSLFLDLFILLILGGTPNAYANAINFSQTQLKHFRKRSYSSPQLKLFRKRIT